MTRALQRVAVVGAGTMGHGIAYVAAAAGYEVRLTDATPGLAAAALARIRAAFATGVLKGKITADAAERALASLTVTDVLGVAVAGAELIIEAVPEQLELKRALFRDIERLAPRDAILASNTSSLSISAIAEALSGPDRFVGLHFFNPVPAMKLLEIVRGSATSETTIEAALALATAFGKTPIVVRDAPGFATSRLGVVIGLEAMRMLEQEVASASDIDRAMELGYNHPMGPLRLTDLVGLDVRLAIADHLHRTLGGDTYRAPNILRRLVAEGKLGKKTGQGFYRWETDR